MKYFTQDMWAGWQSDNVDVYGPAIRKWKRNLCTYRRLIQKLAPKLGRGGRFFTNHSMHDASILEFAIHDFPLRNLRCRSKAWHTSVHVSLLTGGKTGLIYHLLYEGVSDIQIKTSNNLFSLPESRFGDWGYDELLQEHKDKYRHNVLFSTGSEITIVFERFNYYKTKASNQQIRAIVAKRAST